MLNRFVPPEICDHIVDLLQENPEALKQCCLVSKSWVLRTRKHLFAVVEFRTPDDIEAWKKSFPDPSNSPAHRAHTLSIKCLEVVTTADAVEGGWISTFSRVVRLKMFSLGVNQLWIHLSPFHKFSHTLKSLDVAILSFLPSQVINFICNFPLLENFSLLGRDDDLDEPRTVSSSRTSPVLTGTLELHLIWGTARVTDRLLDLQNGLRFRNLKFTSYSIEDILSMEKLVDACSDTLEHLDVWHQPRVQLTTCLVDLSKATKLKEVVFRCGFLDINWVNAALKTIVKHRELQRMSIDASSTITPAGEEIGRKDEEQARRLWSSLDPLLIQLWESHSIRTGILFPRPAPDDEGRGAVDLSEYLLPESTKRGIIDSIESRDPQ